MTRLWSNRSILKEVHWKANSMEKTLMPGKFSSVTQSHPTLYHPMDCSAPGFPVHRQLLELTQTHVYQVSDAIQPSHPLSSPSPAFHLSQHRGLFQWVSSLDQVDWSFSFSFSISPSSEYSGPISFRMDRLDLLAVQETFESLLQHLSSKALIIWCSTFFMVQLSHPYVTTGKTIALIRWTFVSKDWRQKEKRAAEDEMVRKRHWLRGHESERAMGDTEGQGSVLCCGPWGSQRVWHDLATEQRKQAIHDRNKSFKCINLCKFSLLDQKLS